MIILFRYKCCVCLLRSLISHSSCQTAAVWPSSWIIERQEISPSLHVDKKNREQDNVIVIDRPCVHSSSGEVVHTNKEYWALSWYQLCRHWWHRRLSSGIACGQLSKRTFLISCFIIHDPGKPKSPTNLRKWMSRMELPNLLIVLTNRYILQGKCMCQSISLYVYNLSIILLIIEIIYVYFILS